MADSEKIVGIDLGTTFSAIAYIDDDDRPQIIKVEGEDTMPSTVLYNEDGSVTVGREALNQAVVKSQRVVQWIKRSMGEDYQRLIKDSDDDEPKVGEDGQVVEPPGRKFTPQQVSAEILKKLVAEAQAELGVPIKKAVITCPAWFTDLPRKATKEAGELAGLTVLDVVNEPTAAALYYGLDKLEDGELLVVYDLGGGTFDCSVIEHKNGKFKHLSSDGNRELGGHDWTEILVKKTAEKMAEVFGENPLRDPLAKKQLYENCEQAKRDFSKMDTQRPACTYKGRSVDVEVTRKEFEEWTEPKIQTTLQYTERALKKIDKTWNDVHKILLVGGSTRLRRVPEALRERSGKDPIMTGEEDTMVALGAAVLSAKQVRIGRRRSKLVTDLEKKVQETAHHALGMLAVGSSDKPFVNSIIIDEGTEVPAEETKDFATIVENQEVFDVPILQGRNEDPSRCSINQTYRFKCAPNTPKGSQIGVTFSYNGSNQIGVAAVDRRTNERLNCEPIEFQMPQAGQGGSGSVDLCFVVDATGSMGGCIDGVKQGVGAFCNDLTKSQFDYRLALVEYRDERIGERLKTYDWTEDVEQFRQWVGGLQAGGGGDEPESAIDGVVAGLQMQGRSDVNRVIVLITDASTHDPDQQGNSSSKVADMLKEQGVRLFAISPILPAYEKMAEGSGGEIKDFNRYFRVGAVDPQVFKGVLGDLGSTMIRTLLGAG